MNKNPDVFGVNNLNARDTALDLNYYVLASIYYH
jgi:hypothetical protein